jgi:hypothetical protein
MEFSQDNIIDLSLTIAGYMAAGALWTVLYSLFTRPQKSERAVTASSTETDATRAAISDAVRERRSLQYVDLRGAASPQMATPQTTTPTNDRTGNRLDQYRRNRAEVVRLAREMLKDGRSQQQVRELLPITDGELALLATE